MALPDSSYMEDSTFYVYKCQVSPAGKILLGLCFAHLTVLMSISLFLAFKTRKVTYKSFRESRHIFLSVLNATFTLLLTAPVLLLSNDTFTVYTVNSLCIMFSSASAAAIIFVPKVCCPLTLPPILCPVPFTLVDCIHTYIHI